MEYFKSLLTPKHHDSYDQAFKENVDEEIKARYKESYVSCPKDDFNSFTFTEIEKSVLTLKMRKAPGYDAIAPEHLKHAGNACLKVLQTLFNSIAFTAHISRQFKVGIIIPIPKADKDRALRENNRGITLLGTISKVYDKAVITRIRK